jgi:hypothetical protein
MLCIDACCLEHKNLCPGQASIEIVEITESDPMGLSEVSNGARGPGDQSVVEYSGAIAALPTGDLSSPPTHAC